MPGDPQGGVHGLHDGPERRVVFMFPGQGAQYVNMGRELYDDEPGFRAIVDRCTAALLPRARLRPGRL